MSTEFTKATRNGTGTVQRWGKVVVSKPRKTLGSPWHPSVDTGWPGRLGDAEDLGAGAEESQGRGASGGHFTALRCAPTPDRLIPPPPRLRSQTRTPRAPRHRRLWCRLNPAPRACCCNGYFRKPARRAGRPLLFRDLPVIAVMSLPFWKSPGQATAPGILKCACGNTGRGFLWQRGGALS